MARTRETRQRQAAELQRRIDRDLAGIEGLRQRIAAGDRGLEENVQGLQTRVDKLRVQRANVLSGGITVEQEIAKAERRGLPTPAITPEARRQQREQEERKAERRAQFQETSAVFRRSPGIVRDIQREEAAERQRFKREAAEFARARGQLAGERLRERQAARVAAPQIQAAAERRGIDGVLSPAEPPGFFQRRTFELERAALGERLTPAQQLEATAIGIGGAGVVLAKDIGSFLRHPIRAVVGTGRAGLRILGGRGFPEAGAALRERPITAGQQVGAFILFPPVVGKGLGQLGRVIRPSVETFRVPTAVGEVPAVRTFGVTLFGDIPGLRPRGIPVVSRVPGRLPTVGAPTIDLGPATGPLDPNIFVRTPIETAIFRKALPTVGRPEVVRQFELFETIVPRVERARPPSVREFARVTKTLNRPGVNTVLAETRRVKGRLFGSFATEPQLPTDLVQRIPGDIDVRIPGGAEEAAAFAQRLVVRLRRQGNNVRIRPGTSLVEVRGKDGQFHHAIDIKSEGVPSLVSASELTAERTFGLLQEQRPVFIEGIAAQPLGEQVVRKGASIFTLRGGVFAPRPFRTKDIPDFFATAEAAIRTKGPLTRARLQPALVELRTLFPGAEDIQKIFRLEIPLTRRVRPALISPGPSVIGPASIVRAVPVSRPPTPPSPKPSPVPSPLVSRFPSPISPLPPSRVPSITPSVTARPISRAPSISPLVSPRPSPRPSPAPPLPSPSPFISPPKVVSPVPISRAPSRVGVPSPSPFRVSPSPDRRPPPSRPSPAPFRGVPPEVFGRRRFRVSGEKARPGFAVFFKRRGKFLRVGPILIKEAALDLGARITSRTLAAQFKIVPVAAKPIIKKPTGEFAKLRPTLRAFKIVKGEPVALPKGQFIEKRGFRLSTKAEVSEIIKAKKVKGFFGKGRL